MNWMGILKGRAYAPDINQAAAEALDKNGAVLLDVRTHEEYRAGHIGGSTNLPLDKITRAGDIIKEKSVPVYVYCQSGARSARACAQLKSMGFENAVNIGGICSWRGKIETGEK